MTWYPTKLFGDVSVCPHVPAASRMPFWDPKGEFYQSDFAEPNGVSAQKYHVFNFCVIS